MEAEAEEQGTEHTSLVKEFTCNMAEAEVEVDNDNDDETFPRAKKKLRRVSFADTTHVHFFEREEDTPEESHAGTQEHSISCSSSSRVGYSSPIVKVARDFTDDNDSQDTEPSLQGRDQGTPTAEAEFFGPVSGWHIQSGLNALSPVADDMTLDSATFTLQFRKLIEERKQNTNTMDDLKTSDHVFELDKRTSDLVSMVTPTMGSVAPPPGENMILTTLKKTVSLEPGTDDMDLEDSKRNDSSLIEDTKLQFDYASMPPDLASLLAQKFSELQPSPSAKEKNLECSIINMEPDKDCSLQTDINKGNILSHNENSETVSKTQSLEQMHSETFAESNEMVTFFKHVSDEEAIGLYKGAANDGYQKIESDFSSPKIKDAKHSCNVERNEFDADNSVKVIEVHDSFNDANGGNTLCKETKEFDANATSAEADSSCSSIFNGTSTEKTLTETTATVTHDIKTKEMNISAVEFDVNRGLIHGSAQEAKAKDNSEGFCALENARINNSVINQSGEVKESKGYKLDNRCFPERKHDMDNTDLDSLHAAECCHGEMPMEEDTLEKTHRLPIHEEVYLNHGTIATNNEKIHARTEDSEMAELHQAKYGDEAVDIQSEVTDPGMGHSGVTIVQMAEEGDVKESAQDMHGYETFKKLVPSQQPIHLVNMGPNANAGYHDDNKKIKIEANDMTGLAVFSPTVGLLGKRILEQYTCEKKKFSDQTDASNWASKYQESRLQIDLPSIQKPRNLKESIMFLFLQHPQVCLLETTIKQLEELVDHIHHENIQQSHESEVNLVSNEGNLAYSEWHRKGYSMWLQQVLAHEKSKLTLLQRRKEELRKVTSQLNAGWTKVKKLKDMYIENQSIAGARCGLPSAKDSNHSIRSITDAKSYIESLKAEVKQEKEKLSIGKVLFEEKLKEIEEQNQEACEQVIIMRKKLESLGERCRQMLEPYSGIFNVGEQLTEKDTFMLIDNHLQLKTRMSSIRQDTQIWKLDEIKGDGGCYSVRILYGGILYQRFVFKEAYQDGCGISSLHFEDDLIEKIFAGMNASDAFRFVFNLNKTASIGAADEIFQVIRETGFLYGTLVDILDELQSSCAHLRKFSSAQFFIRNASELELQLTFLNILDGIEIKIILRMDNLSRGVYPYDALPVTVHARGVKENAEGMIRSEDISEAISSVKPGYRRLENICKCVSRLI